MLNFMFSKSDNPAWGSYTREEIRADPHPGGNNVQHGELVDLICAQLKHRGWGVTDFRGTLTEDRRDLACSIGVGGTKLSKYFTPHLGVMATYSRKFAARFFCGGVRAGNADETPLVAGFFTVDVPSLTDDPAKAAGWIVDGWAETLGKTRLDDVAAAVSRKRYTPNRKMELLFRVGRTGVIPWSRVGLADAFLRRTGEAQGWAFYRIVADMIGAGPPVKQMTHLDRLRGIVLEETPDPEPVAEAV